MTARPQPSLARGLSVLWFPVAYAILLGALALNAYTHPRPHDVSLGVVGSGASVTALADQLHDEFPGGFAVRRFATAQDAVAGIRQQEVVAAIVASPRSSQLLVTSASDYVRTAYLEKLLPPQMARAGLGGAPVVKDVVPRRAADVTGNAMMFWGLPLLVIGYLTSVLLLPFAAWSLTRKVVAIALIGAASSAAVFAIAVLMRLLPAQPLLIVYGFLLTQAIAWICTGISPFLRQFFIMAAVTFVLILGSPTSGGTVPADLLPDVPRWLNAFMPFAQTIALGRAASYFNGHGTFEPLAILVGWAALGAGLMIAGERHIRHRRAAQVAEERRDATSGGSPSEVAGPANHELVGTVRTFDGASVEGATVTVLNAAGRNWSGATDAAGSYRISGLPEGQLYAAVVAPHSEPDFSSIAMHRHTAQARHDVALVDLDEQTIVSPE